mmetsp:Transcript_87725/g.204121  ORF Transcript_87725/g.204121 Transcript_87725/m.204121 type:complete len:296 (-) Transcript_87725:37-924(-)
MAVQLVNGLLRVLPRVVGDEGKTPGHAGVQVLGQVDALQPTALAKEVLQVALPAVLREIGDAQGGLLLLCQVALALAFAVTLAALLGATEAGRHVPGGALAPGPSRWLASRGLLGLLFVLLRMLARRTDTNLFVAVKLLDAVHVGPDLLFRIEVRGKREAVLIELVLCVVLSYGLACELLRHLDHHLFLALHAERCLRSLVVGQRLAKLSHILPFGDVAVRPVGDLGHLDPGRDLVRLVLLTLDVFYDQLLALLIDWSLKARAGTTLGAHETLVIVLIGIGPLATKTSCRHGWPP